MAKKAKERICFVIAPIGEPNSPIRKRSDKVFRHIISPVVTESGYKPLRADKISKPGIITSQVIQYVVDSPLVIADLTDRNPNVFYELAIRHAAKKPYIQLIKKGEQIPFDVAVARTVQFDITDLDNVEDVKNEISKLIKSIEEGDKEVDNPISVSLELKFLKESKNPEQRSLADVVEAITSLRSEILAIEKKLSLTTSQYADNHSDKIEYLLRIAISSFDKVSVVIKKYIKEIDKIITLYPQKIKRSDRDRFEEIKLELIELIEELHRRRSMIMELIYHNRL